MRARSTVLPFWIRRPWESIVQLESLLSLRRSGDLFLGELVPAMSLVHIELAFPKEAILADHADPNTPSCVLSEHCEHIASRVAHEGADPVLKRRENTDFADSTEEN